MNLREINKIVPLFIGISLLLLLSGFWQCEFMANKKIEVMPTYLYKVLSIDDWAKSAETIHLSNMDADFIHFSTEDQLDKIIEKYWSDVPEYIVLKIEVAKLPGKLVLEANPGGTNQYYHLYNGSIPRNAVVELKKKKKESG